MLIWDIGIEVAPLIAQGFLTGESAEGLPGLGLGLRGSSPGDCY